MVVWLRACMLFAMSVSTLHMVSAQDYPNRPLRVVTSEVGAGGDFTARLVAQGLTAALGQPAVVACGARWIHHAGLWQYAVAAAADAQGNAL